MKRERLIIETPLGRLALIAHDDKLAAVDWTEEEADPSPPDDDEHLPARAAAQIAAYFAGDLHRFDLPLAPAGTPPEAVAQVLKDATDALARPEVREQLRSQGLTPVLMKPVEFAAHIKAETATWAGIIKARSIVAE